MRAARSIQARLLVLLLGGLTAVWLAAAVFTWRDVRHELDELLDAHLAQAAALLVVQQTGELEHDDDRTLDAPSLHRYAPRAVFQVFHDGQLVLRSADAPRQPLREPGATGLATVASDGRDWRVFAARGSRRDVQVFVGERMDARSEILRAALWGTLWPLAVSLPLLALLAWWAIRRGLAPLRTLGDALASRPASSPDRLQLADAPAEVVPVVDALNGLLDRIGRLREAERRFTADAAHELRTPIAAIRTQAQVALADTDDAQRRHALKATIAGCDRAAHLVEQLMMLSQLEAAAAVQRQPVELGAVARQVVAELAPRALGKGQDLSLSVDGRDTIEGEPTLLSVLLRNLVDNAIRYAPAGARIVVAVERDAQTTRLQVHDSGPGLSAEAIAQLGRRFHRGLGHDESGSGLGWSIVQRIAEVHGLAVTASRSAALGGLAVTVAMSRTPD